MAYPAPYWKRSLQIGSKRGILIHPTYRSTHRLLQTRFHIRPSVRGLRIGCWLPVPPVRLTETIFLSGIRGEVLRPSCMWLREYWEKQELPKTGQPLTV